MLSYQDGSSVVFAQANGASATRYYASKLIDAQGNEMLLQYDAQLRLTTIEDAIGQQTTISYTPQPGDNFTDATDRIRTVTDPFGRNAQFKYTATGQLYQIIDPVGIVSEFGYDGDTDFISSLITPYGTTTFAWGDLPGINQEPGRFIEATDPLGDKERAEANDYAGYPVDGVDPNPAPTSVDVNGQSVVFYPTNENLFYRNTYYWDRQQMRYGAGDYSKATIYNWKAENNIISAVLNSYKPPLENRVWFNYPGQASANAFGTSSSPAKTVRSVEDENGQPTWTMVQTEYDPNTGKILKTVDPLGREVVFEYNEDGLTPGAVTGVDLTAIKVKEAGGYETIAQFSQYTEHLPQSVTDAAGQVTTFTYNAAGQILTEINPLGDTVTYSYDSDGYLQSVDGPLAGTADTTSFTYDAVGRLRTIEDYDGYVLTYDYDNLDRVTRVTYPDATYEEYTYQNLDQTQVRDRLGRTTNFAYNAIRELTSVTDPAGRSVSYEWCRCGDMRSLIDPMGRATRWHRDVQGRVLSKEYADGSKIRYEYEDGSGRLSKRIDEEGQITRYRYNIDGTLHSQLYPNAQNSTPTVSYTYDPFYNRVVSMTDGIGTTQTSYYPVGGNGANQVSTVDGPWDSDEVTYAYDVLGRVTSRSIEGVAQSLSYDAAGRLTGTSNPLGSFTYNYDGVTSRLSSVVHSGGMRAEYSYHTLLKDKRLSQIKNLKPDGTTPLSVFDYDYDVLGRITSWTQQVDTDVTNAQVWTYGYDNADQLTSAIVAVNGSTTQTYGWAFDDAGNRLTETLNSSTTDFSYNALNQLDYGLLTVENATYEWDAEDRLLAINRGNERTEFQYDGLGRRVAIIEKTNGSVTDEKTYLWCGLEICEQRESTGSSPEMHFFPQGFVDETVNGSATYLYNFDHLGSIRELAATNGNLQERISYDAWGNAAYSNASPLSPFSYTGHLAHHPSSLVLAPYRAYDPSVARWISRDPIGEGGGLNLYGYGNNSPIVYIDSDGRVAFIASAIYGGFSGAVGGYISGGWKGALFGGAAGALVGVVNPYASHYAGAAAGAFAASLAGQAAGNYFTGKDVLDRCNYSLSAAFGAGLGGAVGGPLNSAIVRYVAPIRLSVIGRPLGATTVLRTPGQILGALAEGTIVGAGELGGLKLGEELSD